MDGEGHKFISYAIKSVLPLVNKDVIYLLTWIDEETRTSKEVALRQTLTRHLTVVSLFAYLQLTCRWNRSHYAYPFLPGIWRSPSALSNASVILVNVETKPQDRVRIGDDKVPLPLTTHRSAVSLTRRSSITRVSFCPSRIAFGVVDLSPLVCLFFSTFGPGQTWMRVGKSLTNSYKTARDQTRLDPPPPPPPRSRPRSITIWCPSVRSSVSSSFVGPRSN